ncbi:MAG: RnfABCDGE type electron transport complex subunit D [Tissierellia bacterium]|nr:RnfABCDGE type electron transport complex subunit D [Tissierellia bacterium]
MENQINQSEERLFSVTSSPHIRTEKTTNKIMLDVIIAMFPALIASIYFYGVKSLILTIVSVISCVAFEAGAQKVLKKEITVSDLSAVVTGILIAFNIPPSAPWWTVVFGAFMAMVIVKQLFGGLGSNFVNPALTARAMIMISWPAIMSTFEAPIRGTIIVKEVVNTATADAITYATPLGILKNAGAESISELPSLIDMFVGGIGGSLGETSAILLILGGIYLIIRGVIDWQTPVAFIATVAIMLLILGVDPSLIIYHVISGGLILGAFFMATDYSTTPVSLKGRVIFAVGAGIITAIIRVKGGMPEGVSYSILFMNILTPLIESFTAPKVFGKVAKK